MDINRELLNFYVYKKLVPQKECAKILEECRQNNIPVRDYLLAKEYITEVAELEALGEYYNIPVVEIDMLKIDDELFKSFSFNYMKKHKVIPVRFTKSPFLIRYFLYSFAR